MLRQLPIFQGRGVEAKKSNLQVALPGKRGLEKLRGRAGRRRKPLSVTEHRNSPRPYLHPSSGSTPTHSLPRPLARWRHRVAAGRLDAPPTEWEPEAKLAAARWRPGTAGTSELAHLGKRQWETAGMREAAGGAGALLASLSGRDPVLRVGAGGESWAVLAARRRGEKETGTEPDAWEGLVCFWDGRGRMDRSCVCAGRAPRS